jgi:hypothetical protein
MTIRLTDVGRFNGMIMNVENAKVKNPKAKPLTEYDTSEKNCRMWNILYIWVA